MNRLATLGAAGALLLAAHAGCTKKPPATPPKLDPDANSGPDAKRSGATPIELDHGYTDSVDYDKGDRTDWKSVDVKSKGMLSVDLHWDTAATDLTVDVFDGIGVQIAPSPASTGEPAKHLSVPITDPGAYFIRVQAPVAKSGSDYTLKTSWKDDSATPPPPPEPVAKEEHHEHHHHAAAKPKHAGGGRPEDALQGRIVNAHAEGGGEVLYLDKGSAAGVKEGQNGWILSGSSGFDVLEGGTFTITKVVDEARSVGKTGLKSVGRNTRIAINVGK